MKLLLPGVGALVLIGAALFFFMQTDHPGYGLACLVVGVAVLAVTVILAVEDRGGKS